MFKILLGNHLISKKLVILQMLLAETTRPRKLQDVIGQEQVISRLRDYTKDPWKSPHMIFYGPPGCGKTSTIYAWANEVYGKDAHTSVRSMNLSGERSVQTIIQKVHSVCRYYYEKQNTRGLFVCDEADCMTSEAQEVMAYCMNLYEKRWIFVFIMNRLSDLSERLREMCEIHPFYPVLDSHQFLKKVLPPSIPDNTIQNIRECYGGDLRRILNSIQGLQLVTDTYRPEWEWSQPELTRLQILNKIHTAIQKYYKEMTTQTMKELMQIAIGLHRPGSLKPYRYAFQLAVKKTPNFFPDEQYEHNGSGRSQT